MELLNDFLIRQGEVNLLDLLEITAQDLVDRFPDKIELKLDYIESQMEEE